MARPDAGVSRTNHSLGVGGNTVARNAGTKNKPVTAAIAGAPRRKIMPTATLSTATTATMPALPTIARTTDGSVIEGSGNLGGAKPLSCNTGTARKKAVTLAASPMRNVTAPATNDFATSTWLRRGAAANVVRIMSRRYSEVTNRTLTAMIASDPTSTPSKLICTTSSSGGLAAISPEPLTSKTWSFSAAGWRDQPSPMSLLLQAPCGWPVSSPTLSNLATPSVLISPTAVLPACRTTSTSGGDATKNPTSTVSGSSSRSTDPICVHFRPSADSYPVIDDPDLVRRSHRGLASELPAMSASKFACMRTPSPGVTATAAYGEPAVVDSFIMTPAIAASCGVVGLPLES